MSDFTFGVICGAVFVALCLILADDVKALVRKEVARSLLVVVPPTELKEKAK